MTITTIACLLAVCAPELACLCMFFKCMAVPGSIPAATGMTAASYGDGRLGDLRVTSSEKSAVASTSPETCVKPSETTTSAKSSSDYYHSTSLGRIKTQLPYSEGGGTKMCPILYMVGQELLREKLNWHVKRRNWLVKEEKEVLEEDRPGGSNSTQSIGWQSSSKDTWWRWRRGQQAWQPAS